MRSTLWHFRGYNERRYIPCTHIYNIKYLLIYQRFQIHNLYVKEERNRSSIGTSANSLSLSLQENNIHPERSRLSWRKNLSSCPRMNVVITLASIFPQLLVIWVRSDIQSLARFLVHHVLKFTQTVSYLREISLRNWTAARTGKCDQRISMTFRGSFMEHFVTLYTYRRESAISLYPL